MNVLLNKEQIAEIRELQKNLDLRVRELNDISLDKDLRLGYTSAGPHRDDIKIEINNIDVREFGSQGQQRTTTLALKLQDGLKNIF